MEAVRAVPHDAEAQVQQQTAAARSERGRAMVLELPRRLRVLDADERAVQHAGLRLLSALDQLDELQHVACVGQHEIHRFERRRFGRIRHIRNKAHVKQIAGLLGFEL